MQASLTIACSGSIAVRLLRPSVPQVPSDGFGMPNMLSVVEYELVTRPQRADR